MIIDFDNFEIVDLSLPIDEHQKFEPFPVKISRLTHTKGIQYLNRTLMFGKSKNLFGKIKQFYGYLFLKNRFVPGDFPDGEFLSDEKVMSSVHTGTHVDAPFHFGSTCAGEPASFISEINPATFVGNGVVLDVSSVEPGNAIVSTNIEKACRQIGHKLQPNEIVLLHTGADSLWGSREYFTQFPGVSREATEYILDHGVRLIGIDTLGFDRPYYRMINEFLTTRNGAVLWPSHFLGRERRYLHIERLANLDAIPNPTRFVFCGLPIKVLNVGASWIRAVAFVEKSDDEDETTAAAVTQRQSAHKPLKAPCSGTRG